MEAEETLKKPLLSMRNAYLEPRKIAPGCQHRLGCKCDTPFWLREPTPRETKFEELFIRSGFVYAD